MARVMDLCTEAGSSKRMHFGRRLWDVNVTVYNQGTIAVSGFEVTNYFHALMSFDGAANPTWVKDGDYIKYAGGALNPGQQINIPVKLCVKEGYIKWFWHCQFCRNFFHLGEWFEHRQRFWFKGLTPDSSNDAGGTYVNYSQDNYILGVEGVEDRHDPVYLGVNMLTLLWYLHNWSEKSRRRPGSMFDITVL